MSHSARPTYKQTLDVLHLMIDVAALKADPLAQRTMLVDGLCGLVGIRQGVLVVGEDWRPGGSARYSQMTMGGPWDPLYAKYVAEVMGKLPPEADGFADHSINDPSTTTEFSIGRLLSDRESRRRYPHTVDIINVGRVSESIAIWLRQDGGRVVGLGLHAFGGDRAPTTRARALAAFAAQEVGRLVRVGHLLLPPVQPTDLPPRLRQILDRLLSGQNPKRIATDLGISLWTVRDHIQRLYRHFGVNGRDELAARFIKGKAE